MKRLGKQTLALDGECYILGRGYLAGKKEKDGNYDFYIKEFVEEINN